MWPFKKKSPKQYCLVDFMFTYVPSGRQRTETIECEILKDYGDKSQVRYTDPHGDECITIVSNTSIYAHFQETD